MYVHSGQSDGVMANDIPPGGFTWPTIWHRLDAAGIDWAYYFSDIPAIALVDNLDLDGRVRRVLYEFIDDCASGKLPPVCYVDPAFGGNDDHPPHDPRFGQQFISLVYNALAQSPLWSRTLLIQIYDENGGFYDHVPPPKAADDRADQGFDQLGFRIPAIIVGPWVKQGFVSSAIHDHTSCLAQIEHRFDLEPLTKRDAAALDLTDCIDADNLASNTPLAPIAVPAVEIDESKLSQACYGNDFLKRGDILAWADQAALPPRWDLRGTVRDQLYEIGDILDGWGVGRIVRGR
jgi:phospholipase C